MVMYRHPLAMIKLGGKANMDISVLLADSCSGLWAPMLLLVDYVRKLG